jgi:hypothetical protein
MCNFKDTIGLSNNIVNKDIIGIWELKCEENY